MWPRRKRHGVILAPTHDISIRLFFICSSGHVLQWDKEEYRRELVLHEEVYVLCLGLLEMSNN